mmetsp:Transcript_32815/g.77392  ORF Transcript_32815/g.77392 Transcript_32815/m.77392 type:complete len:94 (-) Transcript_32815:111-392(-)
MLSSRLRDEKYIIITLLLPSLIHTGSSISFTEHFIVWKGGTYTHHGCDAFAVILQHFETNVVDITANKGVLLNRLCLSRTTLQTRQPIKVRQK